MPFGQALGGILGQSAGQAQNQQLQGLQSQLNNPTLSGQALAQRQAMMQQQLGQWKPSTASKLSILESLKQMGLIDELEIRELLFGIESLSEDEKSRLEIRKMLKFK